MILVRKQYVCVEYTFYLLCCFVLCAMDFCVALTVNQVKFINIECKELKVVFEFYRLFPVFYAVAFCIINPAFYQGQFI